MVRRHSLAAGLAATLLAAVLQAQPQHQHNTERARARLFAALGAKEGAVVADVGAGDGGYAVPLAKTVGPSGRVIAVDVSSSALDKLRARIARESASNIDVIQGDVDNPRLTPGSLDGVLIVNAYHEMSEHQAMLGHIRAALKPAGRLVIADFATASRRAEPRAQQTGRHEIAPELVQRDLREAGFQIVGFEDPFLEGDGGDRHVEWLLIATPVASDKVTGLQGYRVTRLQR